MNDLEEQTPRQEQEDQVERTTPEVPRRLSGLEWLVKQAQRKRDTRRQNEGRAERESER
ncbi:hypothetical protein [Actinosynnema sp. NPDC020468]|uniref:hypothetical protein n=1 Tax=Actinosynnema sp. NPDC020468 TaxID=3154488 RepID=UPI0033DB9869